MVLNDIHHQISRPARRTVPRVIEGVCKEHMSQGTQFCVMDSFAAMAMYPDIYARRKACVADPTRPYQTLTNPTRPYKTLPDPIRPYQTSTNPTSPYHALPDLRQPYQTLPDLSGVPPVGVGHML